MFIIACQDDKWLNGDKKYSVKEGYKWLKGPQETFIYSMDVNDGKIENKRFFVKCWSVS